MASPSNPSVPDISLNDGNWIPTFGLGLWQTPAGDTEHAVSAALDARYRNVDTAAADGNDAHGRTPAQVQIRWHVQLGNIVIPESAVYPDRIASNFDVFDFELGEQDMASIASLDD